jgi:hypothetical protein
MIRRVGACALAVLVAILSQTPAHAGEAEATLVAHGAALLRTTIYSADPNVLGFVALAPFYDADLQSLGDEPELSATQKTLAARSVLLRRMLVSGEPVTPLPATATLDSIGVSRPANSHRWWLVELGLADAQIHAAIETPGAASHTNYLYDHRADGGGYAMLLDGDGLTKEIDEQFPQTPAALVPAGVTPQAQAQRGIATLAAVSLMDHPALAAQPPVLSFIVQTMRADVTDAPDQGARELLERASLTGDASHFRELAVDRWNAPFVAGYFLAAGCANAVGARDVTIDAALRKRLAVASELDAIPAYVSARATYLASPATNWPENYRILRSMARALDTPGT